MARDQDQTSLSFDLPGLLADKEAAYEFLREYTGLEIADNIRRLREDGDLTQAQLAEILDTTQSVVARLEDEDYKRYSLTTLQKVAEAFDVWPTVVFEPYQWVIHRAVVNARPMIRPSVGNVTWTNVGTSTWSDQWVTQRALVNVSMIQPSVGTLAWGNVTWTNVGTSTRSDQWVTQRAVIDASMIQPSVGTLVSQTRSRPLFVSIAANDGLNFDVGFVEAEGAQVAGFALPVSASSPEITEEHDLAG